MSILQGDRAVLLIANRAYTTGTYWVTISQPGAADISWSFNVS
jgi:hypothetical protein